MKGEGLGPFESGILVVYEIKLKELGRYKLRTSFNLYDIKVLSSIETIRHVLIYSEPFTVVDSFDNSRIRLSKKHQMLFVTTYANVYYLGYGQIDLINQVMKANARLKELYGDFVAAEIESKLRRKPLPAVSSSPGL